MATFHHHIKVSPFRLYSGFHKNNELFACFNGLWMCSLVLYNVWWLELSEETGVLVDLINNYA